MAGHALGGLLDASLGRDGRGEHAGVLMLEGLGVLASYLVRLQGSLLDRDGLGLWLDPLRLGLLGLLEAWVQALALGLGL